MNSWAPFVAFAMLVFAEAWMYRRLEKRVAKVELDNLVLRISATGRGRTLQ